MTNTEQIRIVCQNPDCKELYTYTKTKGHKRKVCNRAICEEWNAKEVRRIAEAKADKEASIFYEVSNRYYDKLESHAARVEFLGNLYEEIKINREYIPRNLRRAFCEKKINHYEDANGDCVPGLAQAFHNFARDNRGNTPMEIFNKSKSDADLKGKETAFTPEIFTNGRWKKVNREYNSDAYLADNHVEGTIDAMTGGLVQLSTIKASTIAKAKDKAEKAAKKASDEVAKREAARGTGNDFLGKLGDWE